MRRSPIKVNPLLDSFLAFHPLRDPTSSFRGQVPQKLSTLVEDAVIGITDSQSPRHSLFEVFHNKLTHTDPLPFLLVLS